MARVLRPGGYLLLNASNRRRLSLLLDPWHCPALDRPRAGAKRALTAAGVRRPAPRPPATAHRLGGVDPILVRAGRPPRPPRPFGVGPLPLLRSPEVPYRPGAPGHARI